ncbi:hypothetical protein FOZ61_002932 [Perkinsus olseni]|uniref:Uncharacterized protein n=1 Tax=Perkinsus olseni TaxID=32597 RepID=A0A7J6M758_PEROL|nr:hypothetical protein FOZ61_002932 [Perkinsus olseni]KAF4667377.1 hypothetical protein FOL46_002564 [Perkinsus olseni]
MLLVSAVVVDSSVKKSREKPWVTPPPGYYKNDSPGVGALPKVELKLGPVDERQRQNFSLALGDYKEESYIRKLLGTSNVRLQRADGSWDDSYSVKQCARFYFSRRDNELAMAYTVYDIPTLTPVNPTSSLHLCPLGDQRWVLYLCAKRNDNYLLDWLFCPVVLDTAIEAAGGSEAVVEVVDSHSAESEMEASGRLEMETASQGPLLGGGREGSQQDLSKSPDQAKRIEKRPFPESKSVRVARRQRAVLGRKTASRDVTPPQRGKESGNWSNGKYYEGQFHVEGKDGVETVVVVVAIEDQYVQLSLQADSRGAHVNLEPLPLVPVSPHCWRLKIESLHENRGVIENTIDAIMDLAGLNNLGFNDFRLCNITQNLSLHLGTAPPLVVALDERERE